MAKFKFNKGFNVMRVVKRLLYTILSLYVGGTILTTFGSVMNNTCSQFYTGLSLIGWTITTSTGTTVNCTGLAGQAGHATITNVSGTGVLSVVGIIGIASVILEVVSW